jgi:hypothetical protein
MNQDKIVCTVLDDGTVRAEVSGAVSSVNHAGADKMLKMLKSLMGGEHVVEKQKQEHSQHVHGQKITHRH